MTDIKTEAIVLNSLRYSESHLIIHLYTKEQGHVSVIAQYAYKARKRLLKPAFFQPLSILEVVYSKSSEHKSRLERLKEVKLDIALKTVHQNIFKNTIAIFLGDFLQKSIKESEVHPKLFEYLRGLIIELDQSVKYANFNVFFILKLSHFLGFEPSRRDSERPYFNLKEGCFEEKEPTIDLYLKGEELDLFRKFLNSDMKNYHGIKANTEKRKKLLRNLLNYYCYHVSGFSIPKSLKILEEIFT